MACAGTSLAPSSTKVAIDWDAVKVRTSTAATIEVSRVALSIPLFITFGGGDLGSV